MSCVTFESIWGEDEVGGNNKKNMIMIFIIIIMVNENDNNDNDELSMVLSDWTY